MIRSLRNALLFVLCCYPLLAAANPFVEGKEYIVLSTPKTEKPQVAEFFSFACHWCYKLDPVINQWLKTKPKTVEFKKVPVAFHSSWEKLAKAYYIMETLGKEKTLAPKFFDAVQQETRDVESTQGMVAFFQEQGVSEKQFTDLYKSSPSIDAMIAQGKKLALQYQVVGVPTVIINGKYKVDSGTVQGDFNKMINIINYLLKH